MAKKIPTTRPSSATSHDVALLAGVSQSAVSRCFNPQASISEKTRQKVLAAAARLNYTPNAIAQSLITRRSNIVAVLITETSIRVTPEILFQLNVALLQRGLHLLLFSITQETSVGDIIGDVLRYKVDGVIACTNLPGTQIARCSAYGIPVVFYNRVAPGDDASSVSCDHVAANRDLADRLYASGHRKFGFIAGPPDAPVSELRERGLIDRLRELRVTNVAVARGDFSYESGHDCLCRLLHDDPQLEVIVCANDDMALGALDAARYTCGLAIPEQISIVGFDDVETAARAPYRLTTVRQPIEEMARTAVALLVERIEQHELPPVVLRVPGTLMVRESARLSGRAAASAEPSA